ncbi:MAG: hypothetical protein H6Q15_71 [Bacteroidetes bacterium]|nr:hypothetical protein [Bacteroidota bacterium]
MKKLSLFFILCFIFGAFGAIAQPVLLTHVDFESGIPSTWNVSSGNITQNSVIAGSGTNSCKMKPATTEITLTSPLFTRTAGCNVRLEFSHIPMIKNLAGIGGGKIEVSTDGVNWNLVTVSGSQTSPTGYDGSYGSGIYPYQGSFRKVDYWPDNTINVSEANLNKSYWRNEVFYLGVVLGTSTNFQIRFKLPATALADQYSGWYLDDIRVSQAQSSSNTVRVPQFNKESSLFPNILSYPNCQDVKVSANIQFLGSSAPANPDSIYVEYFLGSSNTLGKTRAAYNAATSTYDAYIPFCGFDTLVKWKLVINDNIGNKTTYPFIYGNYSEFKSIRGYIGEHQFSTTGLSNQEIMMRTNQLRNMTQMRYRASELYALGYRPGKIGSLVYKVTQSTSNFVMKDFNVFIASIDTNFILDASYVYSGNFTQVYNNANLVAPQLGWQVIPFSQSYMWDGVSDLLIEVCWDNPSGSVGGTTKIECVAAPGSAGQKPAATSYQFYQSTGGSTSGACSAPFNSSDGAYNYRPNFIFRFVNDCKLSIDAGVSEKLVIPSNNAVSANTPTPFNVRLMNYGTDTLNSIKVNYRIDEGLVTNAGTWTGTVLPNDSVAYQFPTNPSFSAGYRYVKVWSEILPPLIDWEKNNDTAFIEIVSCNGAMSGEYALGNLTGFTADKKFKSFKEVFKMLVGCGVSAPVIIKIDPTNIYLDSLVFPSNIPGISATNYVKFVSSITNNPVTIKAPNIFNTNIDLSNCKHFKFENITFNSSDSIFGIGNLISMSSATSNIQFKKCNFNKSTLGPRPNSFLNIANANSISVDSCKFDGDALYQIYIKGASSVNLSTSNTIINSSFINNLEGSIYAEYTTNLSIKKNIFTNNRTTNALTIFSIQIQSSNNVDIQKNLFVLNNVSAVSLANILPSSIFSKVANNKISVHNGNVQPTLTNLYGINLISGDNIIISYNNIYARDLGGVSSNGMNLGNVGQNISSIFVQNNIIVSDGVGCAIYARPTNSTSIKFSNNIYWKTSTMTSSQDTILWRYNNQILSKLNQWQSVNVNGDSNSYLENPIFLGWNNLTTSNTFLCYKGLNLTEILDDFNHKIRPTTTGTCIGAVQFDPPPSNIFVQKVWIERGDIDVAPDGLDRYSDCGIVNEYVKIKFSNISPNTINPGFLKVWFKIDNLSIPNSQKDTITYSILPNVNYTYQFRLPYNFSAVSSDKQFKITAFSVLSADSIYNNDTAKCYVVSRFQQSALPNQNININYGDSVNLSVTSNDSIYWFLNMSDITPAKKSHFYQTSRLFSDSTFYFTRKQEIPQLRISEVQISKAPNQLGVTPNIPVWITQNNAVEISNFGNGDINLNGYKIETFIGGTSDSLPLTSSKSYTFGNYILPSNKCVTIQYSSGTTPDSSKTIYVGTGGNYSSINKIGFWIKNNQGAIVDAVAINKVKFRDSLHVPASIWSGFGHSIPTNTAGIIRNTINANDSNDWTPSSTTQLMTLTSLDSNLIFASDNGCYGFKSAYNITVSGVPSVDPGVAQVKIVGVNSPQECTLLDEKVQVRITNTGVQPSTITPLVIKVYESTNPSPIYTIFDTCFLTVQPADTITYIVPQTINLASNNSDKTFTIEAIANLSSDVIRVNDTSRMQIVSLKTPLAPLASGVAIPYGSTANLTATNPSTNPIIWYDNPTTLIELSRTSYITPNLYKTDTFYVGEMLQTPDSVIVNNNTNLYNQTTTFPSPLNAYGKNVKEQYLFRASELQAMGMVEGNINNLALRIFKVNTAVAKFSNFTIKIGNTSAQALTIWQSGLQQVYNSTVDSLRLNLADSGWRKYNFIQPFYYDGVSNLVVEVCFTATGSTSYVQTYYSQTPYQSSISYRNNTTTACAWSGSPSNIYLFRPNIKFGVDKFGCSSVRTPVVVTVGSAPGCDPGLTRIVEPYTQTVMSGISIPIKVELKNFGADTLTSLNIGWSINNVNQTPYIWTGSLKPYSDTIITIGNKVFISGINTLKAWTILACDTVHTNDTASFSFSSCIGNNSNTTTLTIGGSGADFPNIVSAVTALGNSGICGSVIFDINPIIGGYNEQVLIPNIYGTSDISTITFRGNSIDSNSVKLTYNAGANVDKYALKIDGASYIRFENFTIEAFGNNYPSVVEISNNSNNIVFDKMVIKSIPSATPNTEVTSLLNVYGVNDNLTIKNTHFFGGANSIYANLSPTDSLNGLTIKNSFFNSFAFNGLNAYRVNNVNIEKNKFRQYGNVNISKALALNTIYGSVNVASNDIYQQGGTTARTGIELKKYYGNQFSTALVSNNSISMTGPKTNASLNYIGLNLDTITYANIFYNTVNVKASNLSPSSKSLSISSICSDIKVINNNLVNNGKGYAYHVNNPGTQVSLSNNNNYYSNGSVPIYWNGARTTLALLQTANSQDLLSQMEHSPFINDSVLELNYPTPIVRAAEPLDDVTMDILGRYRPISPKPTIGAYEYQFVNIDCGVIDIVSPERIRYVENEPLEIRVKIKNFGLFAMDSVKITALLKFNADTTNVIQTVTQTLYQTLNSLDQIEFSLYSYFYPPLHFNLNDSLHVCVFTTLLGDTIKRNDTTHTNFVSIPGYNLQAVKLEQITERCQLYQTPLQVVIKNTGEKTLFPSDSVWVEYVVNGRNDLYSKELLKLPYTDFSGKFDSLPKNNQLTYTFTKKVNFYPTGLVDTTWKVRAIATLNKDNVRLNDTTAIMTVTSRVSPPTPIVYDTSIHYGTWAKPWAEQVNSYPIKWYKDSTDATPFFAPNNYGLSMQYSTTQLFVDSLYYVRVNLPGTYPCNSYFSKLTVSLLPRSNVDAATIGLFDQGVVYPPNNGYVYMSYNQQAPFLDTVMVKVSNYGTQPLTNFPITYSVQATSPVNAPITTVTEVCSATIQPDASYIYRFDTLANIYDHTKTYKFRTWVKAQNDLVPQNDTSLSWNVKPKNGDNLYCPVQALSANTIDITRVQMGNVDNFSNPYGLKYTNFTKTVEAIKLYKGVYDSLYVTAEKPSSMPGVDRVGGWVRAFIDWNRDGQFDTTTELVMSDTIISGETRRKKIEVPLDALNGHSRMRIVLWQLKNREDFDACTNPNGGEVEDYLVNVSNPSGYDAELMKFTSPDELLTNVSNDVIVLLRNIGTQNLTSATITWKRNTDAPVPYAWSGNLAPGDREYVLLNNINVSLGLNIFRAFVDAVNDTNKTNDSIRRDSYIFKQYTLPYKATFDEVPDIHSDDFYAKNPDPNIPTNCWELGQPSASNTVIKSAFSAPNCWKTNLSGNYPDSNESVLYSPIFDIGIIKPDTLSFMMRRSLAAGSFMYVQYYQDWSDKWVKLGGKNDGYGEEWYNSDNGFDGTKIWTKSTYSMDHLSYNLGNKVQFRFVFKSGPSGTSDGFAIDNIELRRALRDQDVGVISVEMTPTLLPNYGSYYYPKVQVKNFGKEKLSYFSVCYMAQNMNIPECEQIVSANLDKFDTLTYTFKNGKYVNVNMPNPFSLVAYTRLNPTDLYTDNDSTWTSVVIGPLEKDAALLQIVSPNNQVVSNEMTEVSVLVKNKGLLPISTLPVSYTVTGQGTFTDVISFEPALASGQSYVYRFNQKFRTSYGSTNIKAWTGLAGDFYHDNDTLYKRIEGTSSTRDIEAKYITIDDYDDNYLGVQLTLSNNSSIGIDSVKVGYYINGDIATAVEETYRLNSIVPSGTQGHHYFKTTLPRANAPYNSICGFVRIANDNNSLNDTTCTLYIGERDATADTIFVEHNSSIDCKVQLRARNIGSLGGAMKVKAYLVVDDNWSSPIFQYFDWLYDEPNPKLINYMTFATRIPKKADRNYVVEGWIVYEYDKNRSNDTTNIVKVLDYVGLEGEVETENTLVLEQNVPNPYTNSTTINFSLPSAGNTRFFVVNNMGQLVYNENKFYSEGKHEIVLKDLKLPQGMYYYTMEFEGKRQMKKMIVTK